MKGSDYWFVSMLAGSNELVKTMSNDVIAGIAYAFSTLEKEEQTVLLLLYRENAEYPQAAERMGLPEEEVVRLEKEAFRKLRLPGRWNYIRYGVAGYLRKRVAQERAKAYHAGYMDGYLRGQEEKSKVSNDLLDAPVEALVLSHRAQQCLIRNGVKTVREVATLKETQIRRMRGLGAKTAAEIAGVLRKHGVICTLWDKFYVQEE